LAAFSYRATKSRPWKGATAYRRMHGLDERAGTAVTIQRMVFGNAGSSSGAGVGFTFTRDPANGENRLYLDFALNAQGEDVVSGRQALASADRLDRLMPERHAEVVEMARRLEHLPTRTRLPGRLRRPSGRARRAQMPDWRAPAGRG
jgi:phosphoenolpyruvate synthase/pyruvate phosphate dikinase